MHLKIQENVGIMKNASQTTLNYTLLNYAFLTIYFNTSTLLAVLLLDLHYLAQALKRIILH
jgi:hypothetical protein